MHKKLHVYIRCVLYVFLMMFALNLSVLAQAPASTRLAFVRDGALYVLEAGSTAPILIDNSPSYDFAALWSPDGTKLAYMTNVDNLNRSLRVWDGTQMQVIISASRVSAMAWTRDGKIVYMLAPGSDVQEFIPHITWVAEGAASDDYYIEPINP